MLPYFHPSHFHAVRCRPPRRAAQQPRLQNALQFSTASFSLWCLSLYSLLQQLLANLHNSEIFSNAEEEETNSSIQALIGCFYVTISDSETRADVLLLNDDVIVTFLWFEMLRFILLLKRMLTN